MENIEKFGPLTIQIRRRMALLCALLMLVGCGLEGFAEDHSTSFDPILKVGKRWKWKLWDPAFPEIDTASYGDWITVTGDSILPDGRKVKVISGKHGVIGVGYEDDGHVYVKPVPNDYYDESENEETEFEEILNFNVKVGESFNPGKVVSVETLSILEHPRKVITFSKGGDYNYWIEGIGSPTDSYLIPNDQELPIGYVSTLVECWQDDELIYSEEAFNKATGMQSIPMVKNESSHQLFDLSGRLIQQPDAKSVYIKDGKKFLGQ